MKSVLSCIEECGTRKLLNIYGRGSENGNKVILYSESGEANEKWHIYQSGAIKSYSAKNKALTYIPETNKLVIWDYNVKDLRQHFMFKSVGEGRDLIVSKFNGKVMSTAPPRNSNLSFITYVENSSGIQFRRSKTSPTILTDTMGGVINWAVRFGSGHRNKPSTEESYGKWYRLRNAHANQYLSVVGEEEDQIGMITEDCPEFDKSLSWWFFHDHHICNSKFRRHCVGYEEGGQVLSLCEFNSDDDGSQKWKLMGKKVLVLKKDRKALHVNGKNVVTFVQQKGSNRFYKNQIWDIMGEKKFPSRYFQPLQKSSSIATKSSTPIPGMMVMNQDQEQQQKKKGGSDDDGFVVIGEWGGVSYLDDGDDEDIKNEEVMTRLDFEELIKNLKEAKYSTERERLLREVAGKEYIRCDQLEVMLSNLLFVDTRLWCAKLFRARVVDKKNAMILTKHFDFEDEKLEVLNCLKRKKRRNR